MCVVSFVGDEYGRTFPYRWPNVPINPQPYQPAPDPFLPAHVFQSDPDNVRVCEVCGYGRDHWQHPKEPSEISKEEFDALKKEVEELRDLLLAAKRFDEMTDQPDCEMDEKVELIRQVADLVGVDVDEVFGSRDG